MRTKTVGNSEKSFLVFDDGHCVGGTKMRLLGRLLLRGGEGEAAKEEVVYAGPDGGIAQVRPI